MSSKEKLRNCYCSFESNVTDQHDQKLLHGFHVDWEMAKAAAEQLEGYTPHRIVENAITAMTASSKKDDDDTPAAYHTMVLPPVNELELDLALEELPKEISDTWVDKQLKRHLKKHAKNIKSTLDEQTGVDGAEVVDVTDEEEKEETKDDTEQNTDDDEESNGGATLLLCNANNLVFLDDSKMMVNPNIPVPDWFRCCNYRLVELGQNFRVLPLLRQVSSVDTVYSAVDCTVDEFQRFKDMHKYGTSMKHDEAKLWNMACNYSKELIRANNTRKIREIIMFKHRTLCGVLVSGAKMRDLMELTHRLNITLV